MNRINVNKYPVDKYNLASALRAKSQYDLTLVVDKEEISAHRLVLATASPVFSAMFAHDTKESIESRVVVKDTKPDVIRLLVAFAYHGQVKLNSTSLDTLESLLVAADKYQMEPLRQLKLKPNTATRLLLLADRFKLDQLYADVVQVITNNLPKVVTSSDWIDQQNEVLKKVLQAMIKAMKLSRTKSPWK